MTATATTDPTDPARLPDDAPSRAEWVAQRLHLPLAGLLTVFLTFRAGGFFPDITAIAVLVLTVAMLLRITVAADPFAGWSRAAAVAVLAAAGFASWTLISGAWSDASGRALVEFDRALLYVLAVAFYATVPRDRGSLTVLLRWVLLAFTAAAVAGLASRLAPDVFPISGRYLAERLSFPLTYWNATGIAAALGVVLAIHHGSGSQEPRLVRIGATAALPLLFAAVYFTFSRGAIVAGALGAVAYVVVAHPRRLLFLLAAAGPACVVALTAAYGADALATDRYFTGAGPGQGHDVALVLALACLGAAVLRTVLLRFEDRLDGVAVTPGRRRALLAGTAVAAVLVAGVTAVAIDAPTRIDRELTSFKEGDFVPQTGDARDRLTQSGNNGRLGIWRVSEKSFADHPWRGTGAGTFRVEYERRRDIDLTITDGHSLYLEVLGELGLVGMGLLALALGLPLGFAAARLRGGERHAYAAFLAAALTLLVHAGVDWDWEMPAVFLWLFAASGVVLAAPVGHGRIAAPPRLGRVIAGLACLVLAVTPWLLLRSQAGLESSLAAFQRHDCRAAIDHALGSRDALSARAEPFELIGYCDMRAGADALAVRAMSEARDREPRNWRFAYGLALAQARAGQDPRAEAAQAVRFNPREPAARALQRAFQDAGRRGWRRVAARTLPPPGLGS
jgi:O-antigen ligase/polysaccharide polymerase Wzy-like membrane protein